MNEDQQREAYYEDQRQHAAYEEQQAEAAKAAERLHQAAPDLLASLKELVEAYEDPQMDDPHALVVVAKAAIDKAEGR